MAYWQEYTFSTKAQFVIDFAAFAAANGWTINANGTYGSSYRRVHFSKGSAHFECYEDATSTKLIGCTGYAAGSNPDAQPGVSGVKNFMPTVGVRYWLVSTVVAIYIGAEVSAGGAVYWGCFYAVQEKIGNWNGGHGLHQPLNSNRIFNSGCYGTSQGSNQMYFEGAWSPTTVAGAVSGSTTSDLSLLDRQPFKYNAGILPLPVGLFRHNLSTTTLKHPLGFAPGLFRINAGDVYVMKEELVIGADTYLVMPINHNVVGSTNHDLLFKLGA